MNDMSAHHSIAVRLGDEPGPTFAIAFGGGGARGLAHIHIIEAMDELGIRPVMIAGASIGAIMGAGMASGLAGADIRAYALGLFSKRAEVMSRLWKLRPAKVSEMFTSGFRFAQFDVERVMQTFLPEGVKATFEDLSIPLSVLAADYYAHQEVVFTEGDLFSALAASAAIPGLFKPVRRGGRIYVDGGLVNPVPFDLLQGKADVTIGIDVVGGPDGDPTRLPNAIESMFGATQLVMQSVTRIKLRVNHPEILIKPPVSRYRVMDFMKTQQILANTASVKDDFKRAVEAAVAAHNVAKAGSGI